MTGVRRNNTKRNHAACRTTPAPPAKSCRRRPPALRPAKTWNWSFQVHLYPLPPRTRKARAFNALGKGRQRVCERARRMRRCTMWSRGEGGPASVHDPAEELATFVLAALRDSRRAWLGAWDGFEAVPAAWQEEEESSAKSGSTSSLDSSPRFLFRAGASGRSVADKALLRNAAEL